MVRAIILAVLGLLFFVVAWWMWSSVPELTMENMDELVNDRSYAWLSRAPGIPFGLGLVCLVSSAWLAWRQSKISLLRREYPSAIVIEVEVSKESRREHASAFHSRDSAFSYVLLMRESSISLWAGLPPRLEVFVEASALRAFGCDERAARGGTKKSGIVLEWNDGETRRRLSLAPIGGGLRGISAPPPALTAAAVQRGRELIGFQSVGDSD